MSIHSSLKQESLIVDTYSITLKPVYSCPASEPLQGVTLPPGWTLAWHQAETFKALSDPNIDVVFNTAMTGDGKTLAACLDVLLGNGSAMVQYPTNELARDQEIQIQGYVEKFNPFPLPRIGRLSGAELELYAENEGVRKSAVLETHTSQREILLSNPDILHYLHRGAYLMPKDSPDKLWGRIDEDFDLFIFDEFHVFNAPQIASVINTLLLIRYTKRQKKFLFLSATPNQELLTRLNKVGFRCVEINPIDQNKYVFPSTIKECQELEAQKWRKVSREIKLNFISLEPSTKASENWLKDNQQLILDYFQNNPGSKGAIILNSIAAVKRLTPIFTEFLKPYGLTVGENTGLSGKGQKERSLSTDLVLGTSTIDVGVDFKINFLIFESSDTGTFIQRLGRLGRHDDYEKDGKKIAFTNFTAYALTPNFLVGSLFLEQSAPLEIGGTYDRKYFNEILKDKYYKINDFSKYYSRWGAVQSVILCGKNGLGNDYIKRSYAGSQEAFKTACEEVFETKFGRVAGCLRRWRSEWQQFSGRDGNPIADEAASFRGSSPLQCGIYDLTEAHEIDRFKTYDLPGIISNLEIEVISKEAFLRSLHQTAERRKQPIPKSRFEYCLAFMKLHNYREERLNWRLTYPGDLQPIADAWKVQVLLGIQVWQPQNRWISEINKRLRTKPLVSYVLPIPMIEVRKRLRLPMHFQIYELDETGQHDRNAIYSVAFGQSALLLETLAYRFKSHGGELWIC
ncbi:CRISPR-associated helicase, Cas3 family [Planktothrix tepida]|uniref:CRISPR-associated helicase, Cas3 family n=1 Tax=Planktothrix tepida PCC 9214 TaxID=671072 RepID=A0A1J1LI63_9CYAN|nr:type I-D CRISPR-associated helicase Cas3' [Planktothrix tepida]CAD5984285.1 CRISPR-associated helicase, Cas3 family [Planktothrix tepida]CUR32200.1 CRISPR-associated helicase, Cas3 family [Planktothrix tepida PCC 9214]